jgi:hypothetical protein
VGILKVASGGWRSEAIRAAGAGAADPIELDSRGMFCPIPWAALARFV